MIHKTYNQLQEQVHDLQDQNSKLLDKQYQDSYTLENWKNRMKKAIEQNEKLEKENKALKELVKLWA